MVLGAILAGVSALAPAIPGIIQGFQGLTASQKPPAGTPLIGGQQAQLSRPFNMGGTQLGAPRLTPIEQLIRGGQPRPQVTSTQGTIAPSRKNARVGQYYYTASGQVRKKHRSKKKKKKAPRRRRRRLSKSDKYKMAFAALAGGAQMNQIAALNMLMG